MKFECAKPPLVKVISLTYILFKKESYRLDLALLTCSNTPLKTSLEKRFTSSFRPSASLIIVKKLSFTFHLLIGRLLIDLAMQRASHRVQKDAIAQQIGLSTRLALMPMLVRIMHRMARIVMVRMQLNHAATGLMATTSFILYKSETPIKSRNLFSYISRSLNS